MNCDLTKKYQIQDNYHDLNRKKPWNDDLKYFQKCQMSVLALTKILIHCQQGGKNENMGNLVGIRDQDSIIIFDALPLPIQGTETRVNAGEDATIYQSINEDIKDKIGKKLFTVGWYHSHPSYRPYLSKIDVETQRSKQKEGPSVAIVVDHITSIKNKMVDIGCFRTFPPDHNIKNYSNQFIRKIEEYGHQSSDFYEVPIQFFMNTSEQQVVDNLWKNFWDTGMNQNLNLGLYEDLKISNFINQGQSVNSTDIKNQIELNLNSFQSEMVRQQLFL